MRPLLATLALAAALALATPTLAQELSAAQQDALAARVAEFDGTMRAGDMAGLMDFMPARIKQTIADEAGVSVDELEAAMREQMDAAMAGATIDAFSMDLDALTTAQTPDGGRTYALIPTTTEITMEGMGRMRAASQTLAFEDEGTWNLLRVDDPNQVAILQAAYPEFAGVAFTPGTMEQVE